MAPPASALTVPTDESAVCCEEDEDEDECFTSFKARNLSNCSLRQELILCNVASTSCRAMSRNVGRVEKKQKQKYGENIEENEEERREVVAEGDDELATIDDDDGDPDPVGAVVVSGVFGRGNGGQQVCSSGRAETETDAGKEDEKKKKRRRKKKKEKRSRWHQNVLG